MNLIEQVTIAMKQKRSNVYSAEKLGIPLEKYLELKDDIREQSRTGKLDSELEEASDFHTQNVKDNVEKSIKFEDDLKNKKASLEYTGPKEVKTKEDLVRECNIDLDEWDIVKMVQNAWGKEGNQNYQVKAWLEKKTTSVTDTFETLLNNFSFQYTPAAPVHINTAYTAKTCAVLSLQDIHVGKENIDGVDDIVEATKRCVEDLVMRAYHSCMLDKIIFVLGGDLLNVDTYLGTTTSGTQVESSSTALEMYTKAFDLMFWCINYLKQFCNELEVVYIPGNHDRLSSGQLAYSLSKVFSDPKITWNIEYSERKVVQYGENMICVEHGDVSLNKSFFVFASQYAPIWGATKFRTLYSGHYHKEKKIEYITTDEINGFTMRILPSLSRSDRYHMANKWINNKRGGIIELHHITKGPTGTFSYFE